MRAPRVKRKRFVSGESLVETMAAVLVCSLAVLMLYTAVASASRINGQADARMELVRQDALAVEAQQAAGSVPDLRQVSADGFSYTYTVEYFVGPNGTLEGYRLEG